MRQVARIMKTAVFIIIVMSIMLPDVAMATSGQQNPPTKPQADKQRREEVITVSATRLPVRLSDLPVAAITWEARDL